MSAPGDPQWFEAIAAALASGQSLTRSQLEGLLETRNLIALGVLADDVRKRLNGDDVTFVRVLDVPVEGGVPAVPPGTGEVRITGLRADDPRAETRIREVVEVASGVPVTACVLHDLDADRARAFRAAGLSLIASASVDRLLDRTLLDQIQASGLGVARWTVQSYDPLPLLDLLDRIAAFGQLRVFAPLPTVMDPAVPTTGYDDVKVIAVARLALTQVRSISVDWSLYGPKLAQVGLTFGAADFDGVPAESEARNLLGPRRGTLEDVRRNIRAASRVPVQRNAWFEPVSPDAPAGAAG